MFLRIEPITSFEPFILFRDPDLIKLLSFGKRLLFLGNGERVFLIDRSGLLTPLLLRKVEPLFFIKRLFDPDRYKGWPLFSCCLLLKL